MIPYAPEVLWIVIVGFIIAFFLSFGVGANDVANSFGTSVGSKVLTLRNACILATIFETLGAILLGYNVSDTIRKGIFDVNMYNGTETELMLGCLSALTGSALWNILATFFRFPISGTHSIVGAMLGFTLVANGAKGIKWENLGKIAGSWVVSPVLSGIVTVLLYIVIKYLIINKPQPLEPGLRCLPVFYGITVFVNVISVLLGGASLLGFDKLEAWHSVLIALGVGGLVAIAVWFIFVPRQRRTILALLEAEKAAQTNNETTEKETPKDIPLTNMASEETISPGFVTVELNDTEEKVQNGKPPIANGTNYLDSNANDEARRTESTVSSNSQSPLVESGKHYDEKLPQVQEEPKPEDHQPENEAPKKEDTGDDKTEIGKLFTYLQILTAIFGAFAHGGNDVSNAVGPIISLWLIYETASSVTDAPTPIWLLLYGGIGISIGLWIWGRRVIQTLGEDLTKITPSSGFTIEIAAAGTVLAASNLGIPISTTHCKVGSVVFLGLYKSRQGVDWKLFGNIILAWILTLPISAGLSATFMAILRAIVL